MTPEPPTPQPDSNLPDVEQSGIEWDALRYLAGEMSEMECREFEDLLGGDQPQNQRLREAVAEMSCLTGSLHSLFEETAVQPVSVTPLAAPSPVSAPVSAPANGGIRRFSELTAGGTSGVTSGLTAVATVATIAGAFLIGWFARPQLPASRPESLPGQPLETVSPVVPTVPSISTEPAALELVSSWTDWNSDVETGSPDSNLMEPMLTPRINSEELDSSSAIENDEVADGLNVPDWMVLAVATNLAVPDDSRPAAPSIP